MKITSKRRRTKAQIAEDKLNAQKKEADITLQLGEMDKMRKEMAELKEQVSKATVDKEKVEHVELMIN